MKKFLYLYSGGNAPATPEAGRKMMNEWNAYFAKLSGKLDNGGPLGPHKSVGGKAGSQPSGFSILTAKDMDEAVALTKGHPHLANKGTIDISEIQPIPR